MSENKNYNDKDAIKVKNPIADALDRLTAAFNGSSSDGGESGNVKTATLTVTLSADTVVNNIFAVTQFDPVYNAYLASNPLAGIPSGSKPIEVEGVAVPCAVFRYFVKSISGEYEDDDEFAYLITGDCEIALVDEFSE